MKLRFFLNKSTLITKTFTVATAAIMLGHTAQAADGDWINAAGGTWTTQGNWAGTVEVPAGVIADGVGSIADFSTIDITAPTTVSLDAPVTVGSLVFGDVTPTADPQNGNGSNGAPYGSSATITGGWVLNNNATPANTLTLDVSTGQPTITVNNLGTYWSSYAVVSKSLTISAAIAGTDGLTKNGVAKLTLSGPNAFSGGVNVTEGILTLTGTQGFSGGINVSGAGSRLEFSTDIQLGNTTSYAGSPPPSVIANNLSMSEGATLVRTNDSGDVGKDTALNLGTGGASLSYSGYSYLNFYFNLTGDGAFTLNSGNKGANLKGDNSAHTGGFNINTGDLNFWTSLALPAEEVGTIVVNANGALGGGGAYFTVTEWLQSELVATSSTGQIQLFNRGGTGTATLNEELVDMTGYDSLFLGVSTAVDLGTNNILRFKGSITPAGNTYRLSGSRGATLGLDKANILTGNNNLIVGNGVFGEKEVNLYASNDFTGTTTVAANNKNKLNLFASNALGTGAVSMLGKSALTLSGGITLGNALTLNGVPDDGAIGSLHNSSGANAWTGGIALGGSSRIVTANTSGNSLTLGDIDLNTRSLTFIAGGGTGGDIAVNGAITGTAGITKTNTAGTLTLGAASSGWSGNMSLQGGTLAIGNDAALGTTGTLTISNSPTIRSTDATAQTIGNPLGTFAGTTPTYTFGAVSGGTGNLTFSNTANASIGTSARIFAVHNTTRFNGGLTGAGASINKTGNGTMILNGTNGYTGGTTVTNGTLGGIGTIGATTVLAGATLAPGDGGIGAFGTDAVTVDGTLAIEINGGNCDLLSATGAVDLDGATLTVSELGTFTGPYVIVEGDTVTGTMIVPSGYAVDVSNGYQAILTKTGGGDENYGSWASENNVSGGANGDSDNDGISNAIEYGLNTNLTGSSGSPGTYSGNVVTFQKRLETSSNPDLSYRIEISTDLGITDSWEEVGSYITNNDEIISATLPSGAGKNFARLQVVVAP